MCRSTLTLVTPSTANVQGGAARCGSTQPPMHASTWQRMPCSAASAAISGTGSTTPWAYDGAEATTSTVVSSMAAAMAAGSARRVVGVDVDEDEAHAEVLRRLVERRVRRRRHDHAGLGRRRGTLTGRQHREEDRLGAAGGDGPGEALRGVEQAPGQGHEVVLHPQQRREGRGVQAVGRGEHRERLEPHGIRVGEPGVVHVGEGAPTVGGQVHRLQGAQGGEHLVGRGSGRRRGHRDTSWSSRYPRSTSRETATSAAGTMVKPKAMAVCAESGCTAAESVDET